jgi:hypothetical protein
MNRSKLTPILSLVFVFASGIVLGGFAYRLYFVTPVIGDPTPPPTAMSPEKKKEEGKKRYLAALTKEAKLDSDQVQKLQAILAQTDEEFSKVVERHKSERDAINAENDAFRAKIHPEFEAVHNHQVAQINAILREDQKALYAAFRAERDRQRKQNRDQHKKQ